jgi:antitoxin VapB
MALAWNPSAAGFKAEDTALVWDSGVEVLGSDADWPTHEVSGRRRPAILEL